MLDLEGIVERAAKGTFSDDIILALKEAMRHITSAGKVANIDSRIAKLFEPRRNHQILNIDYKGEQLFSNLLQLTWIKSSNTEIFTSGIGLTTYNELLDYAIHVPAISIYKSTEIRKTLIIEALKEMVGEAVDPYIKARKYNSHTKTTPKLNYHAYKLIPSTKIDSPGASAYSDIVVKYPDGSVYFPTYQFSRAFLDWFEKNPKAVLEVLYQRHHYSEKKERDRYPDGERTEDGFYFKVLAKGVSATVHTLRFPKGPYLLASEIRQIVDSNGQEVFSRPASLFYEGGIKHKKWNPHDAMKHAKI